MPSVRAHRIARAPATALGMAVALFAVQAARADDAAIGREIYDEHCIRCHGKQMVAPAGLAIDLRKFPRNESARFKRSVLKGTAKGMPAWEGQLSAEDIQALWDYLNSVKSDG